jgi:hypothetical protein
MITDVTYAKQHLNTKRAALPFSGTFHERVRSIPETKPIEGTEVRPRSS